IDIPSTTTPTTIYAITPRPVTIEPGFCVLRRVWDALARSARRFAPHFRGWRDEVPNQCVSHCDLQKSKTER
ncbi:hypothetical protein BS47DRAFT_1345282, partial [Hydnum rufescens UP504]